MTSPPKESTTVVIVGAGVAGLALGTFLLHRGIACVVLEKHDREYVESRQRAGVIDTRAARMFRRWGLEDRVVGGVPVEPVLNFRVDDRSRRLELDAENHRDGRFCPQQVLVRNLIEVFVADGGDLRFDAEVSVEDVETDRPRVSYRDGVGVTRSIEGDLVAGCDGDHGVVRGAFPAGVVSQYSRDYGYAWLTVYAETPASGQGVMAVHPRGFAAQFPRGPRASRFYLQCPLDDTPAEWPEERIARELELRLGGPVALHGTITSTQLVPLRSAVVSPMTYRALHLVGDAAHIVPPMSAKGMSLALHDADVLAHAVVQLVEHADRTALDRYSDVCLRNVWNYQAYASWWTDVVHNAGDASYAGAFAHRVARADLERLFASPTANLLLSELVAGLN